MKSIKSILIAMCLVSFITSYAQEQTVKYRKFYIRPGLAMPQDNFKSTFNNAIPAESNLSKSGGLGAKSGFVLDLGSYIYVHKQPITDKIKAGLDFTFLSFTYNKANFGKDDNNELITPTFFTISSKLGPLCTYNFADAAMVDVYFKIAPTYLFVSGVDYAIGNDKNLQLLPEDIGFGVKWNTGMTFHYGIGSFSVCYDFGKVKKPYYLTDKGVTIAKDEQIPLNILQVKLGFQL